PEPEPKPEPKPEPEPRVEEKPKLKMAGIQPPKKPKPPPPPDAFAKVLKTLADLKKEPKPPPPDEPEEKKPSFEEQMAQAVKAPSKKHIPDQPLSVSETDVVRQQIRRCWSLPAGAKDAKDLVIEVTVVMNPDGTVRQANVVDEARMRSDPFFRAAAESARRAVLDPRCSPLKLPPEKYSQWQRMTLNFNPKDMF
ncbi:MAG: energy transducer TonB, partial [Rhodospirillales bacterium]|nr:energy transducer TonB [Rhodospirillales bacterium]